MVVVVPSTFTPPRVVVLDGSRDNTLNLMRKLAKVTSIESENSEVISLPDEVENIE